MHSPYKSAADRAVVTRWCRHRLDAWPVPHRRDTVEFADAAVHLTFVGTGPPEIVYVPGTNFNAAAGLDVAAALGRRRPTVIVDLPGQPGLSSAGRPRAAHRGWYGRKLAEALEAAAIDRAVAVGHSLGAAVLLACDSDRLSGRVLLSPAGLVPLRVDARMAALSLRWMLAPTPERTQAMLEGFTAPGVQPPEPIVQWLNLVASHCKSTLAPPPVPPETLRRLAGTPLLVATGAHDRFLPPARLAPATRAKLGVDLQVIDGAGHLVVDERPEEVADLVDALLARIDPRPRPN
ncbi:alpha/beta hydrolase [Glycomyces sp. TRM65418]|uniref:alpha/beta fold hydrolase n=1 Tax=Glycomyces sp. TRM65418 TaxID=2867006 RepID=UPI001CE6B2F8|nr:alpha/beta hydrolase [Glycomyces sp. TRM65418]MCC3763484.1 alpha/beta hydrolase [Glycomyces sp. TRM65418]QZD57470.1 alpha/beta hydrolase [Glycomyces sp. TRM65418]